jgi:hypothetical protein
LQCLGCYVRRIAEDQLLSSLSFSLSLSFWILVATSIWSSVPRRLTDKYQSRILRPNHVSTYSCMSRHMQNTATKKHCRTNNVNLRSPRTSYFQLLSYNLATLLKSRVFQFDPVQSREGDSCILLFQRDRRGREKVCL